MMCLLRISLFGSHSIFPDLRASNFLNYNPMSVTITAQDVKKLRDQTGAGMADCRKALEESGGDFEGAIDYLRKKGQKVAANRQDREAKEGVVIFPAQWDPKLGIHVT